MRSTAEERAKEIKEIRELIEHLMSKGHTEEQAKEIVYERRCR